MGTKDFSAQNIDAWMGLAAAIIISGKKENDTTFLRSTWCKQLTEATCDWFAMRDRDNLRSRGSTIRR